MFLKHFDLVVNPFGMTSGLDFLYKSTAFEESMAHLIYGLNNSEAIVLITGPIGSGKTMSLQSFLTDLGKHYLFALVTNTQVTHVELLKLILDDLGIELDPNWDKSDLLIAFKDYLINARQDGRKIIVVIDEAQNLSTTVLEEVRLLTNLGQGAEQLVQLILVGQPELKEILDRPELEQLRQRIRVHYEVETLSFDEMVGYVNHRMEVAGCAQPAFEQGALKKLFEVSGGIPRLVNTHAGNALLSAFVANRPKVTVQDVEEGVDGVEDKQPQKSSAAAHIASPDIKAVGSPKKNSRQESRPPSKPRRSGNGGRILWIFLALIVGATPVVWYTMFRETLPSPIHKANVPNETPLLTEVETTPVSIDSTSIQQPAESPIVATPVALESPPMDEAVTDSVETIVPAVIIPEVLYYTHVASFRDPIRSQADLERFEHMSFSGRIEKQVVDGNQWYRLYLGPVATQEAAQAVGKRLSEDGRVTYFQVVKLLNADDADLTSQ